MSAKKKIIISVSAILLVILAGVVSVVSVLAAQRITLQGNVTVTYDAIDVYGNSSTYYKIGDSGSYQEWGAEQTFNGGTGAIVSLENKTITLTSTNTYVIFKFQFKKKNVNVENFTVKLDYTSTGSTNVTITKGTVEDSLTDAVGANLFSATTISSTAYDNASTFYVKIAITSTDQNASFIGNFSWTLENVSANS